MKIFFKIFLFILCVCGFVVLMTSCGIFGNDDSSEEPKIHEHSYGEWTVTTEPTCTTKGSRIHTCKICKYSEVEAMKALGHDIEHVEAKAPTCVKAGNNAYDECKRCGYTTYEEIPALGHDVTHHAGQAPTCTLSGWKAYDTCSRCDHTTYQVIPALGHDLTHYNAKDPTCTKAGWNAYDECKRCDYTTYHELPATGHHFENEICTLCGQPEPIEAEGIILVRKPEDNTYEVSGYVGESSAVYIMEEYNGIPVTSIGEYAFYNVNITADSIFEMGSSNGITNVFIPDSVTEIKSRAFALCVNLKAVIFGSNSSLKYIRSGAFMSCMALGSIELPDSLEVIENAAFYYCTKIKEIVIPDSVTSLEPSAFGNCINLLKVTIGSGIEYIPEAFEGCFKLVEVYNRTSSEITAESLGIVDWYGLDLIEPTIYTDEGYVSKLSVDESGFYLYADDDEVYLMGYDGDEDNVIIPDNVTIIYDYAFANYPEFDFGAEAYLIMALSRNGEVAWNTDFSSVTIPNGVKKIGAFAFSCCWELKEVTILGGVTEIGAGAFSSCFALEKVTLSDSIRKIGEYAFVTCINLNTITLGTGLNTIGEHAFQSCPKIIRIVNNSSLSANRLGIQLTPYTQIVEDESELTGTFETEENGVVKYTFDGNVYIYGYKGNDKILDFSEYESLKIMPYAFSVFGQMNVIGTEEIILPDVDEIGDGAFSWCIGLKSIVIPDTVETIGTYAFEGCESLTEITIPESVERIKDGAFYNCQSLRKVIIGNGVAEIGTGAFNACKSLSNITIPDSVISIGKGAFGRCEQLREVTLGQGLKQINSYAFIDCNELVSVYYTGDVGSWCDITFNAGGRYEVGSFYSSSDYYSEQSIEYYSANPLSYAHNLYIDNELVIELIIPDTVEVIKDYAFYNAQCIMKLTIGRNVSSIGEHSFVSCVNLFEVYNKSSMNVTALSLGCGNSVKNVYTEEGGSKISVENDFVLLTDDSEITLIAYLGNDAEVVVPSNVTKIGDYVFSGKKILSVELGDNVTTIGTRAFSGCEYLVNVTIGRNVSSIGEEAFYFCHRLVQIYNRSSLDIIVGKTDNGMIARFALYVYTTDGGNRLSTDDYGFIIYTNGEERVLVSYTGDETDLSLPEGITKINRYSFMGRTEIESVVIPDSVKEIGAFAFGDDGNGKSWRNDDVPGLKRVTLGSGVTKIGNNAFTVCYETLNVYYNGDVASWCNIEFESASANPLYNYHFDKYSKLYINGVLLNDSIIILPDSVTKISSYAFINWVWMESIVIPASVKEIERYAFNGCDRLNSVYINDIAAWCNINFDEGSANPLSLVSTMFVNNQPVYSLVIPDTVTEIKNFAFYNAPIESVTIGSGVRTIRDTAFAYCYKLVEVYNKSSLNVLKGVATCGFVGYYADYVYTSDYVSKLSVDANGYVLYTNEGRVYLMGYLGNEANLTLPDGITDIYNTAFKYNKTVTRVTMPDTVRRIGYEVFYGCSQLNKVILSDNLEEIYPDAFEDCSYDMNYNRYGDGYYLGSATNRYLLLVEANTESESFTIKDGTKIIYQRAFHHAYDITDIIIPESVKFIGEEAFYECYDLTAVHYTGDISLWCGIDFYDEYSNPLYYAHNLYINDELVTDVVIRNGVTEIKSYALYGATSLLSITIPNSVTEIGEKAFYDCTATIIWGDDPEIMTIGTYAFYGYQGESIIVPDSVTKIESYAFYNCDRLTRVNYTGDIISWLGISFISNPLSYAHNLYINDELVIEVVIPDGTTKIASNVFNNATCIKSVTIPDSVIDMDYSAFSGCPIETLAIPSYLLKYISRQNLQSVIITSGTRIENNAFSYCRNLVNVTISDTVKVIDYSAFSGCDNLTNVVIGNGVISVYRDVFYGCDNLQYNEYDNAYYLGNDVNPYVILVKAKNSEITSCTIHQNTKVICSAAFGGCYSLTDAVEIPDGIVFIGGSALPPSSYSSPIQYNEYDNAYYLGNDDNPYAVLVEAKNNDILTCTIHQDTVIIYSQAFYGCRKLTEISIPDSVKSIGSYAFSYCSDLTDLRIGSGVASFGEGLYNIENLTNVYLKDLASWFDIDFGSYCGLLSYARHLYVNDELVTDLVIPEGVTEIKESAFNNVTYLNSITIPNSVTRIGKYAFSGCTATIIWGNAPEIKVIDEYSFAGYRGMSIVIPDSVISIKSYSFSNCDPYLIKITIGSGVKNIDDYVFDRCDKLFEVYNRSSLDITKGSTNYGYIGYYAKDIFTENYTSNISVDENGYILYVYGDDIILIGYVGDSTELILPDGVTEIDQKAFYNNKYVTSVIIPDSVITIGKGAFDDCENLENVIIGNNVIAIGDYAFDGCRKLSEIVIPDSVTVVGNSAFSSCSGLTTLTIGNGVESLGYYAFSGCAKLHSDVEYKDAYYVGNASNPYLIFVGVKDIEATYAFINERTQCIAGSFNRCTALSKIYCECTRENRGDISLTYYNAQSREVPVYFYSETAPTSFGSDLHFWHYDSDGETVIEW